MNTRASRAWVIHRRSELATMLRPRKRTLSPRYLRVSGEPVGAGGNEAVPHARRVFPADGDDSPDRQQSSQQSQGDAEEKPEVAREDPGVPVEKEEGSVEPGGCEEADPGHDIVPGTAPRRRPDPAVGPSHGPGDTGQHEEQYDDVDCEYDGCGIVNIDNIEHTNFGDSNGVLLGQTRRRGYDDREYPRRTT